MEEIGKKSEFIVRYMDILSRIMNDEILTTEFDKVKRIFEHQAEILKRIDSKNWPDDKITEAVNRLFYSLYDYKDRYRTEQNILRHFGVEKAPELVLFDSREEIPGKKYVLAFLVDYNSPEDNFGHSRNGGDGERFYGSGKSQTREEFLEELRETYRDCWWTEVRGTSDIIEEPPATLYYYQGCIYKYFKKGEK